MTQPDNPNDFVSPNSQPTQGDTFSGSKALPVVLIIAGVGCGCLGLLVFLGIIAAIALPSFLNQADKARQAEARSYVGSMVRAQQAYRLKHETFAKSLSELEVSIPPNSPNYQYQILKQSNLKQHVFMTAQPIKPNLKSYTGAIFLTKKDMTIAEICESLSPGATPPSLPILSQDKTTIECPEGSQALKLN